MTWLSDLFKSDAEKQVDLIYGKESVPPSVESVEHNGLSWWDNFKESIMPESFGEAEVRRMLEGEDVVYDENQNYSSPNIYVQAKGAVVDALGESKKYMLYVAGFLLILVIVYAAVPALIRR